MLTAKNKGYTLVEMMMTMVIAAVLLGIGIPGLQNFIKNNRMISQTNGLMTAVKTARSEAMTQRISVVVCITDDAVNCGGTSEYMAFTDNNGDNVVNGTDTIVHRDDLDSADISIDYTACDTCGGGIIFSSRGTAISNNGTLTVCDDRGATFARAIIIEPIGRTRPATDTDSTSDDIVNDHKGNNIVCP